MTSDARVDAVRRLEAALVEEDRLGELYGAAVGTSSEFAAHARLQGAGEQVAARQAWLRSVDDGVGLTS